ncbi:MAG: HD domain-containing protein [Candidatus Brocadiaceae bacterium]|nr:HD domain-containing protein [Candidatus Brocadiaceae bacterium]
MTKESQVSLFDMIVGLSETIDLVDPSLVNHHMQVAYIAYCIGEELGLPRKQKSELILAGSLHDIGFHHLRERMNVLRFEVDSPHKHSELGYLFLNKFEPFSKIATLVRYHHVSWNRKDMTTAVEQQTLHGSSFYLMEEDQVPLGSYVLHLADRVAVLIDKKQEILVQVDTICQKIKEQSGKLFMPKVVKAFLKIAAREYFWLEATVSSLDVVLSSKVKLPTLDLDTENLISFSRFFSRIVDFRSPFSAAHSCGVAAVAEILAKYAGFSKQECQWMKSAGYLHDIGKIVVPVEILEKTDKLTDEEFAIIRKHSFYTHRILKRIGAFKDIIWWASFHHERLSGDGYPFHAAEENIPLGARVLAVANVFSALMEKQAYRNSLTEDKVLEVLKQLSEGLALDSKMVSLLLLHFNEINSARIAAQETATKEYQKMEYILTHPE